MTVGQSDGRDCPYCAPDEPCSVCANGQRSANLAHALDTFRLKRPQVILSLCDGLGGWSAPYIDNDYDVIQIDALTGQDVRLMELPAKPIHGILAAPPCTMFANSGARWVRTREQMLEALSVVDACLRIIIATQPVWWALENPHGKLSRYRTAQDDVQPERLRRRLHQAHLPVGPVHRAGPHARAGDRRLEDASARAEPGTGGAPVDDARGVRPGVLRGEPVNAPHA